MRHDPAPKRRYRAMTPALAAEIRRAYLAREANQRELAEQYGTSQPAVSRIVSGWCWVRKEKQP